VHVGMGTTTRLALALAGTVGLLAFVAPAAGAATARHTTHPASPSSTQTQAAACFSVLSSASEDLDAATYDIIESGPWTDDFHKAQTEMHDPVCTPFTAQIQAPIAQAESLIAQAEAQAAAGDPTDASNTFQSASHALNPAWWSVYLISVGLA